MSSRVIEANQRVHAALVSSGEYQKSPHRSPESVRRVSGVIAGLTCDLPAAAKHLDVGCGDGFMFECTPVTWQRHGIDATPEMLTHCAARHPEVSLGQGFAEKLPFPDSTFDIVTCYSFLDHLADTSVFYAEVLRVLKPSGAFYFGLNPNRDFFRVMEDIAESRSVFEMPHVDIHLEVRKALDDGSYYSENFGIDSQDLLDCEPGKTISRGMISVDERARLRQLGASRVSVVHEWVFQQNRLAQEKVAILREFLPFTSSCFKYFDIIGAR